MHLSRLAALIAAAALLAGGCAPKAAPAPAPSAPVETARPPAQMPVEAPAPPPDPSALPPVPDVLAEPAPAGAFLRGTFRAGDRLSRDGVYFMGTATGAGESWIPTQPHPFFGADISDDNRFITARTTEREYLIDRTTGSVWLWDAGQRFLLLASAHGFLFSEVRADPQTANRTPTGRYFWAGPDFRLRRVSASGAAGGWYTRALLSPDGSRLALLRHPMLLTVDLTSGETASLELPGTPAVVGAGLEPTTTGFEVRIMTNAGETNLPRWHTLIRRFNWQGMPQGDLRIPGNYVFFSPDGRWVAWEDWSAGDLAPVTVLADAASLQPRLRALGATPCFRAVSSGGTRWLADSSGLVVDTDDGYRIFTVNGRLEERPAFAGRLWKDEPQPAPDRPDLFALGRTGVSDGAGARALRVSLDGFVTPASLEPWGATSAELRFVLPPPGKGGACVEHPPVAPLVAPAGAAPELVLQQPVDMRDVPHGTTGQIIGRLEAGTRLTQIRPRSDSPAYTWLDQSWWLHVRTEQGQTGWVPVKAQTVSWLIQ